MKTKNIFKALALAILMPALLLNTACNSDIINNENTDGKGFALPVTINVTRQGDAATRATYTDNGDGTGSLAFSTGDQLFILGAEDGEGMPGWFYGTLTWQSGGTFSGTLTTENKYTGTIDAIIGSSRAYLLPAGYGNNGFLTVSTGEGWNASVEPDFSKTFALTKAIAVEQFSFELGNYDSTDGFVLHPMMAILNFTITGLTASTEYAVVLDNGTEYVGGNVTTDASGNATFAVSVLNDTDSQVLTLTVGGNPVALNLDGANNRTLEAGKIYNITRSAAPPATSLSELKTAINGGTDCSSYIGWEVNSAGAIAESGISGTKIGYVAYVSTSDVDAGVSGSRILVIASADAAANTTWGSEGTARGLETVEGANNLNGYSNTNTLQGFGSDAHPAAYAAWNYGATIPSGGATPAHWFMPTQKQWENMRDAKGGTYGAMSTAYGISGNYWTSSEYFNGEDYSKRNNYAWRFVTNSAFSSYMKHFGINVRSIFAY